MAVLVFQGEKEKTKVIDNNLDPEWNQSFTFNLRTPLGGGDKLDVEVYDFESLEKLTFLWGCFQVWLNRHIMYIKNKRQFPV